MDVSNVALEGGLIEASLKRKRLSLSAPSDNLLKIQRLSNDFRKRVTMSTDIDGDDAMLVTPSSSTGTSFIESDPDSPSDDIRQRKRRYYHISPQSSRRSSIDHSSTPINRERSIFTDHLSASIVDPFSFPNSLPTSLNKSHLAITNGLSTPMLLMPASPPLSEVHIEQWIARHAHLKGLLPEQYIQELKRYTHQLEYHTNLLLQSRRSPHVKSDDYQSIKAIAERIMEAVEWVQASRTGERIAVPLELMHSLFNWRALWTPEVETIMEFVQIMEDMRLVGGDIGASALNMDWFRNYLDEKRRSFADTLRNNGLTWRNLLLPIDDELLCNCRTWLLHRMMSILEHVQSTGRLFLSRNTTGDGDMQMSERYDTCIDHHTRVYDGVITHMENIVKAALLIHDTVQFTGGVPIADNIAMWHQTCPTIDMPNHVICNSFIQHLFTIAATLVSQYGILLSQQSDHTLNTTRSHSTTRVMQFKLIKCYQTLVKLTNCLSTVRDYIFYNRVHYPHVLLDDEHDLLSSSLVEVFLRHCVFLAKPLLQNENVVSFSISAGAGVVTYQHNVMALCATAQIKAVLRWSGIHDSHYDRRLKMLMQLNEDSENLLLEF